MTERGKTVLTAETTEDFREFVRHLIRNVLSIDQKGVADEANTNPDGPRITQPWISQLLTNARKSVDAEMAGKLKETLCRLVFSCDREDRPVILGNLETQFSTILGTGSINSTIKLNRARFQVKDFLRANEIQKLIPHCEWEVEVLVLRLLIMSLGVGPAQFNFVRATSKFSSQNAAEAMRIVGEIQDSILQVFESGVELSATLRFLLMLAETGGNSK